MSELKNFPEGVTVELIHIGINTESDSEGDCVAAELGKMFNLPTSGDKAVFVGTIFEIMKPPYSGVHGHIGVGTNSVEKLGKYLESLGYNPLWEKARYEEDGRMNFLFLKEQVAGFAIHLSLKK